MNLLAEIIWEVIFKGVFEGIFKGAKLLGLLVLKILTANKDSMEEFKNNNKDSSKPYFIGFTTIIGLIYLVIKLID